MLVPAAMRLKIILGSLEYETFLILALALPLIWEEGECCFSLWCVSVLVLRRENTKLPSKRTGEVYHKVHL